MTITLGINTITGVQAGGIDGVPFASGTRLVFQQSSAPVGWTKDVTHNNKAMRVVSGTVSSGGSVAFTTAFASQAVSGSVGNTTLSIAQMPRHSHGQHVTANPGSGGPAYRQDYGGDFSGLSGYPQGISTAEEGWGGAHNHSFSGTAINLAVQYVDIIIATKD